MAQNSGTGMYVKVLGAGCSKCGRLEANAKEALKEKGMPVEVEHVSDFKEIAKYGVMLTPALVVGGKVYSPGKILSKDEIVKILEKEAKA